MERQKKVVDASVIVKWFLKEEKRDEAIEIRYLQIKGKIKIIVPELIFLEVLNAIKYKKVKKNFLPQVIKFLYKINLSVEKTDQFILDTALRISLEHNLSIYDSLYAALAQVHSCQLITEDEKLKKLPFAVSL